MATLSAREREVLEFEQSWWQLLGAKEAALRELFSLSPTAYQQVVGELIERPEALAAYPLLVRRLRRQRDERRRQHAPAR
ncbi:DUF3263 domain-containing protein [Nocardioides dongxiaopingii]|nr:DUF3263 domain-containing protein [Nocardioides sp. S-1144]